MRAVARLGLCVPALTLSLLAAPAGAAVYLSPSGSDGAACTAAAPCQSFDRGFRAAAAGDEVVLAGGTYGSQTLANEPVKGSAAQKVVIHPAAGASVKIGYLSIEGTQNVEVQSVTTDGWQVTGGSAHVVLRGVNIFNVSDTAAYFTGASDVQIIGGEIGGVDPNDGVHFNNADGPNSNITIDGLFLHDLTRDRDSSVHDDCMQVGDVDGLTIRNSRLVNCGTQGIYLNPYNDGTTKNVTIENNWFGPAQLGYYALYVGGAQNVTVRNNSFTQAAFIWEGASGVKMTNNIFGGTDSYTCGENAGNSDVFDYNMTTATCSGATHHVVNASLMSQFTNTSTSPSSALDLHLKSGATAIDRANPTAFPAADFDGQGRPAGKGPDVGADEFGAVPIVGGGTAPGGSGTPAPVTPPAPTTTKASPTTPSAVGRVAALVKPGSTASAGTMAFGRSMICRVKTRTCAPRTLLTVTMTKPAHLVVQFRRIRVGHRAALTRTMHLRPRKGTTKYVVTTKGLRAGSYQVVVRSAAGAKATLRLKVR